jgi:hypothetical protein
VDCIARIDQINHKWEVPIQLTNEISARLSLWTSETLKAAEQPATNHDHINTLQLQTSVGWGHFHKGFITTDLQNLVNTQTDKPQNAFEQMQWSCDMIQCMWDSEAEHWKCHNRDKHITTSAETNFKKQEKLLLQAQELLQTKHLLPPCYKKMFLSYTKLTKKRTNNLETWVNTTKQMVHYLLNVNNQADDDPINNTQSDSSNTDTDHAAPQGLPTLPGSEASQVPPNITKVDLINRFIIIIIINTIVQQHLLQIRTIAGIPQST